MRRALVVALVACASPGTPSAPSQVFRTPPLVDSHVHLAYWPVAADVAASGIGAVVDLGAPEASLAGRAPLHVIASGPMLTSPDGYPLDSWGSDGYGVGCETAACVTASVARLVEHGAGVIKLAADPGGLDPALFAVAVEAAHARGVKVAAHALSDRAAARAAAAGVDVLAHTPVEPLAPSTIEAWRGRAVISTLAAFGGAPAAVGNLRALRAAGVTVLYGTDLGNHRVAGPSPDELALLRQAGLDDAAIFDAMTTAPTAYWKLAWTEETYVRWPRDPRRDVRVVLERPLR